MTVKVEAIARVLSEATVDELENLDVDTLRTGYEHELNDNFIIDLKQSLSLTCHVCFNNFPRNQMESMFLCDHICCTGCLQDYYRHTIPTIDGRDSLKALTCFQERHDIPEEVSMNFFLHLGVKVGRPKGSSFEKT